MIHDDAPESDVDEIFSSENGVVYGKAATDEPPPGLSQQEIAIIIGVGVLVVTAIIVWLVFRRKRA